MKKISYKVVISTVGAIILILQNFGVKIDVEYVNEIITGIAGVLVTIGLIAPEQKEDSPQKAEETKE